MAKRGWALRIQNQDGEREEEAGQLGGFEPAKDDDRFGGWRGLHHYFSRSRTIVGGQGASGG